MKEIQILEQILEMKNDRSVLIKRFQELIWNAENVSDIFSILAYDLDFYEPNEKLREESPCYYGDDRLEEEIKSVIITFLSLDMKVITENMNWKEQLSEIESHFGFHEQRDWTPDIELICSLVEKYSDSVEVYVRAIYAIHNILLEENYPQEKGDVWTDLLQRYFNESHHKFSENAEYLFFVGTILHIAEWYFGLDDDFKPMKKRLCFRMQKKASDKEPNNILYEWAYRRLLMDKAYGYLASQIIEHHKEKIDWLKNKGFPGQYVLDHLQMSNDE